MADTNTDAATETQNSGGAGEGNEASPNGDASNGAGGSDGGDAGDAGGDEGSDDGEDGDGDGSGDGDGDDDIQDDGTDPAVRRDSSYFIGLRHGKKQARKGKDAAGDKGDDDGDDDGDDGGDDPTAGIHPEDAEVLSGAIEKAVKPLTDKLAAQEDKAELDNFLAANPAFKPYEKRIERFMKHPTRSHLPVSTVAMEAVGPEGMMKIGARMARSADTKKQTSKGSQGGGPRGSQGKPDVWNMPAKDFQAMQNEVRRKA